MILKKGERGGSLLHNWSSLLGGGLLGERVRLGDSFLGDGFLGGDGGGALGTSELRLWG